MFTRRRITLIIAWALSLIIVGAFARAQTPAQRNGRADPGIISGSDLGFSVNAVITSPERLSCASMVTGGT